METAILALAGFVGREFEKMIGILFDDCEIADVARKPIDGFSRALVQVESLVTGFKSVILEPETVVLGFDVVRLDGPISLSNPG